MFTKEELKIALMPVFDAVYSQDPESFPFRQPVDPKVLGIPVSPGHLFFFSKSQKKKKKRRFSINILFSFWYLGLL